MRGELWTVAALLAAAGLAWWSTTERMAGMDAGPGTALGTLGWFLGVWATMMAAMMLPSLTPAAAAFATSVKHGLSRIVPFAAGYLLVWSVAGIAAYGLFELGRDTLGGSLAWHDGGRWLVAGVLALAALYQLTPTKRGFLSRCRGPLGTAQKPSPDDWPRALASGLRNGGWCLGCSWALMASLFALGVMSLTWMAVVAVLIALEKLGPAGRGPRLATATVLVALAAAVLAAPHDLPGFVVPGSHAAAPMMNMH
jgi:predicted metal-binding membrane protein